MNNDIQAVSIEELVKTLLEESIPFPARYLYRLSDLEGNDIEILASAWGDIPTWRRKALMEDVFELGERDDLLDFEALALLAAGDGEAGIRLVAVQTLYEYDNKELAEVFSELMVSDSDAAVRSAAASGLSRFVYAGEVDALPREKLNRIVSSLMKVVHSEEGDQVRRSALESLGFSEHAEVPGMIKAAYASSSKEWKASALVAMGRSADKKWASDIIRAMDSRFPRVRSEAATAAGKLVLKDAVEKLTELLEDVDEDTRDAAVLSLAQIGGSDVRSDIEALLERSEDEFDEEFIETVLELLDFSEEMELFPLIDLSEYEDGDELNYND